MRAGPSSNKDAKGGEVVSLFEIISKTKGGESVLLVFRSLCLFKQALACLIKQALACLIKQRLLKTACCKSLTFADAC
jgi:hypothetical protein